MVASATLVVALVWQSPPAESDGESHWRDGVGGRFQCSAKGSSATTLVPVVGAIANGTSDDSDAIQNAIDLAGEQEAEWSRLPAGTFMVNSHLVLKDNVELTGVGPATVIKAGPDFLTTRVPEEDIR